MQFCAFNAAVRDCGAINASQAATVSFVLLGGGKRRSFYPLVHVASTIIPEKESIKCICLIRREIRPSFYPLVHIVSTDGPEKESIECLSSY